MWGVGAAPHLVAEAFSGANASPVGPADILLRVTTGLADEHLGNMSTAYFCTGQVHPGPTLTAFNHGSSRERLQTETSYQVPGVF